MKDTVDTITLQNGGTIQLDKLAYESLQGCTNIYDYHTHTWTTRIEFESNKIETAIQKQQDKLYRDVDRFVKEFGEKVNSEPIHYNIPE